MNTQAQPASFSSIASFAAFPRGLAAAAAVLLACHLAPKPTVMPSFRLLLTVCYFSALVFLCAQFIGPFQAWLESRYRARYRNSGPALEQHWRAYTLALGAAVRTSAALALVLVIAVAIRVLALWFSPLRQAAGIAQLATWVSLLMLVGGPFLFRHKLIKIRHLHAVLTESGHLAGFTPSAAYIAEKPPAPNGQPVTVAAPFEFRAGSTTWHWKEFVESAIVFGQPGSGKTVCVLNSVLEGLLMSAARPNLNPSGLILDPKGDFLEKIQGLCRRLGREADLVVIDPLHPESSATWNPLDAPGEDELELAARFAAAMEMLGMKDEQSSFWIDMAKKFMTHSIDLIRLTNPPGEPPALWQVRELATGSRGISQRADLISDDDPRADLCLRFFAEEWLPLAPQTKSCVEAYLTNMLDPFVREPYRSLFSGSSTVRMADALDRGLIVYVHMPVAEKELMARVVGTLVKLDYFREVLRRRDKKRPSFFLCDEFQAFYTSGQGKGDADFFSRSRQSLHANVVATQNMPALLKVEPKEAAVENLIGNCGTKIFLRNTDTRTNKFASELFGQMLVNLGGSSLSAVGRFGAADQTSHNMNRQYDARVRPEDFGALAIPSSASPFCEAFHIRTGQDAGSSQRFAWTVNPLAA